MTTERVKQAAALLKEALELLDLETAVEGRTLSNNEMRHINDVVDNQINEWYAFKHYSAFREVADPKFHELRKAFVTAGNTLLIYIGREGYVDDEENDLDN